MDEVELAFGGRVVGDIVGAHLNLGADAIRRGHGAGHVDVGGQHVTLRSHPPGQPPDDRVASGPHFPAAPAGRDAQAIHVGEGRRVEELGERGEPLGGGLLGVGQQVAVIAHPAADYRPWRSGQGAGAGLRVVGVSVAGVSVAAVSVVGVSVVGVWVVGAGS